MGFTLHCRSCEWSVEEPLELKGEANWLAGRHISKTGHSVALERVECEEEDFYRGGGSVEVITEPPPGLS